MWRLIQKTKYLGGVTILGGATVGSVLMWGRQHPGDSTFDRDTRDSPIEKTEESQRYLDEMLTEVVTASYTPHDTYIARKQDGDLQEALHSTFATEGKFFMLTGENGVGKTASMQDLLGREYKDGVLRIILHPYMLKHAREDGGIRKMLEADVLVNFNWSPTHPKAHSDFVDFLTHANEVRKQAKGKDAHPLIIYFEIDSGHAPLDHQAMVDIAEGVGEVARDISSVPNGCKAIVEFPKTAVSDVLEDLRGELRSFQVDALTEDEFMKIGRKILRWPDHVQTIADPYLHCYHDWIGGQTRTLAQMVIDHDFYCMHRNMLQKTFLEVVWPTTSCQYQVVFRHKSLYCVH